MSRRARQRRPIYWLAGPEDDEDDDPIDSEFYEDEDDGDDDIAAGEAADKYQIELDARASQ